MQLPQAVDSPAVTGSSGRAVVPELRLHELAPRRIEAAQIGDDCGVLAALLRVRANGRRASLHSSSLGQ